MSSRFALIALMSMSLAACEGTGLPGMSKDAPVEEQGHKGPPGVSPLDAPIETGAEGAAVSTAEARTLNTNAFTARGNEPFWSVDASGKTAIYKTPSNQKGRAVRVERLTFAEGVEYIGVLDGSPFVLTVRGRDCTDSMSGQKFPMTAELKVGGRRNQGCAGPASPEVAQAVAAIKAPAPAAPKPAAVAKPKPAKARPAPAPVADKPEPAADTTPAPQPTPAADSAETEVDLPEIRTVTPDSPTPSAPAEAPTTTPAETPAETAAPAASLPAPALTLPATPPSVNDADDAASSE